MRREGLLQLAYADKSVTAAISIGSGPCVKANDPGPNILQPKNNLGCGVKILFNQISPAQTLLTRSGYWSTLRPDGPSYRIFAKQMTKSPSALVCPRSRRSTVGYDESVQDDAKPA